MKLIKKYLKKHLTGHPKHYYFLRWLADIVMDKQELREVCAQIGMWMVDSDHQNLQFNDIMVLDGTIYIYTYRPGNWIGKGGSVADSLITYINCDIDGEKISDYKVFFIEMQKVPYTMVNTSMITYKDNW